MMSEWAKKKFSDQARAVLRVISNVTGLEISRPHNGGKTPGFELVQPRAGYAPWSIDTDFLNFYQKIKQHTLVDRYRCFELWSLLPQVAHLPGAVIEVGVWRGGTGAVLVKQAQKYAKSSQVFLCDTFEGIVKASEKDSAYVGGEHSDTSKELVEQFFESLGLCQHEILKGVFPDETAAQLSATQFKFCHLDVDVYQSLKDCFMFLWDKLVVGGIIVIDDYGFIDCEGARMFVDEIKYREDLVCIHNLNGHAILIKNYKHAE